MSKVHDAPYTSKMDFGEIVAALKHIGYKGDITFEANGFLGKLPKELYPCGLQYLYQTGNYFRKMLLTSTMSSDDFSKD